MSDQNQTNPTQNDYLNSYVPPQDSGAQPGNQGSSQPNSGSRMSNSQLASDSAPAPFANTSAPVSDDDIFSPMTRTAPTFPPQHVSDGITDTTHQAPDVVPSESLDAAESLEEQNIFELLGVSDGTDEEKETFLDELQQVIWEDFLENDVDLLITPEEKVEVDAIIAKAELDDLEKQEQLVQYIESLVPDLEEIMLEKALELKEELFKERVTGLKEFYSGDVVSLEKVNQAQTAMEENKWRTAQGLLNQLQ